MYMKRVVLATMSQGAEASFMMFQELDITEYKRLSSVSEEPGSTEHKHRGEMQCRCE